MAYLYGRRRRLGLCPTCGGEAGRGSVYCDTCRTKAAERVARGRAQARALAFRKGQRVRVWRWEEPADNLGIPNRLDILPRASDVGVIVAPPSRDKPAYTVEFRGYNGPFQVYETEMVSADGERADGD